MATDAKGLRQAIEAALIKWYDFPQKSKILYIGSEADSCFAAIREMAAEAVCAQAEESICEGWASAKEDSFDVIFSVADLERVQDPSSLLRAWRRVLKPAGRLLLGMNNRLGIRYFCGDRDPYTRRTFDGVEGYRWAYGKREDAFYGRMYSRAELETMLAEAGFFAPHFYSVLPDLSHPAFLFAEEFLPNEDLSIRVFPFYNDPEAVFLEEEHLYGTLAENGLFHAMANAYFIECAQEGSRSDVLHVTCSAERGAKDGLCTVIRRGGRVEKFPLEKEGRARIEEIQRHAEALYARGVGVVPSRIEGGRLVMPFVDAPLATVCLRDLLREDKAAFLRQMDALCALVLASSEHVREDAGDGEGVLLKHGYFDMVPLNAFFADGTFRFYDQEFAIPDYPANVILTRIIDIFYGDGKEMARLLPMDELLARYGLLQHVGRWRNMAVAFLSKLRHVGALHALYGPHQRDLLQVFANRQRVNYSEQSFSRLFVDIFADLDGRKLILFGSGNWAEKFLDGYGREYPVTQIVDNQPAHWGKRLRGVKIAAPDVLRAMDPASYKVVICIKGYLSVLRQLEELGVTHYGIFDPNRDYPHARQNRQARPNPMKRVESIEGKEENTPPKEKEYKEKEYHVGYVSGVFDLFHMGHLNLLRRAKERCDYLIVGVVSDEGVRRFKGVEPFIPFAERVEVVRACRYVDEANGIPLAYASTRDAWRLYHFDVQFSGSDYVDNPAWLSEKDFLEKHGAALVFFPYTEQTSSTKIKALIDSRLNEQEKGK